MAVSEAGARMETPPAAFQISDRQNSEPRVSGQALTFGETFAEEVFRGPLVVVTLQIVM